jgi:hypothetical protein
MAKAPEQLKDIAKEIPVNFIRTGFNPQTEQTDFARVCDRAGSTELPGTRLNKVTTIKI